MTFYAHPLEGQPPETCKNLEPYHGHLNKVAFWSAKFAAEMFPEHSEQSKSAHAWGYLTGLWHDLGKFAPESHVYLKSKVDITRKPACTPWCRLRYQCLLSDFCVTKRKSYSILQTYDNRTFIAQISNRNSERDP